MLITTNTTQKTKDEILVVKEEHRAPFQFQNIPIIGEFSKHSIVPSKLNGQNPNAGP